MIASFGQVSLFKVINDLWKTRPLWWCIFVEKITSHTSITYQNQTTLIISVYELEISEVIILYEILKIFKREKLVHKIINKGEFIIVHVRDIVTTEYLISPVKWLNAVIYALLQKNYAEKDIIIDNNGYLSLSEDGVIHHFIPDPTFHLESTDKIKYTYLYKDVILSYQSILDNRLKVVHYEPIMNKNLAEYFNKHVNSKSE